ncbi:hypothetical protein niasHT_033642 [Heterodera trifolii]|uniref:polynucleotide adenylyltransferase n=1 Tax=Heterodera trifolii TaxID=157864 RepID=A0ABD2I9T6_9BILA
MLSVPLMKITFEGISVEIRFVTVPIIRRLPSRPINAQKIGTFLQILAQVLDKKTHADHIYDEGVHKTVQRWHNVELKKWEKELSKSKAGNNDQIEINDHINALIAQRDMLLGEQRKFIKDAQIIKTLNGMLLVLADFGTYQKILEMLLNEDKMQGFKFTTKIGPTNSAFGKFRLIIAYLQKWAKVNFILSDELGYFGTKTLTLMLIKIFLLYPNGTLPFLVEKFFLTFSAWNWPLPVQLDKIDHKLGGDYLCWTPGREWIEKRQQNLKVSKHETPMPIITPTFPAQNAAKNVNLSTAKLLKNELRKAFDNVRKSVDGIVLTLEKKKFVEKYEHFIIVLCAADKYGVENFCNFVGKRLRHELLDHVERPLAEWVKLCHLLPNWITVAESVPNSDQNIFKRLWLIGIELNTSPKALSKFKSKIKSILKKKFGENIKNNYENKSGTGLETEYVDERQELAQW